MLGIKLLHEVVLDLLLPIQTVLDLQVHLGLDAKIKSLACSEAEFLRDELTHLLRVVDVDFSHLRGVCRFPHRLA